MPLWQEELWREIIRAANSDKPDETRFMEMPGFDVPAASQYAATTPELLRWFDGYNERQPSGRTGLPFRVSSCRCRRSRGSKWPRIESSALSHELWRRREPRPAAPYFKRPSEAKDHAFDRERGGAIPGLLAKVTCAVVWSAIISTRDQIPGRGVRPTRTAQAPACLCVGAAIDRQGSRQHRGKRVHRRGCGSAPLWRRAALIGLPSPPRYSTVQKRYGISDRRLLDEARFLTTLLRA